jgi:hypothetical protein
MHWALPPPIKLDSCHVTYFVLVKRETKKNVKDFNEISIIEFTVSLEKWLNDIFIFAYKVTNKSLRT